VGDECRLAVAKACLTMLQQEQTFLIGEVKYMLVNKAYKFRIYPNKKQTELINKKIGCSRFVFNFFLDKQKEKDAYWYICEEMVQNEMFTRFSHYHW